MAIIEFPNVKSFIYNTLSASAEVFRPHVFYSTTQLKPKKKIRNSSTICLCYFSNFFREYPSFSNLTIRFIVSTVNSSLCGAIFKRCANILFTGNVLDTCSDRLPLIPDRFVQDNFYLLYLLESLIFS